MNDIGSSEQIRLLEEQVHYLGKEKQSLLNALEMAVNLSNFQSSLNKIEDPEIILKTTAHRAQTVIRFKATAFYLVNDEDSSLNQAYCDPISFSSRIQVEVDALINEKTFSWALRKNKPTIISSADKLEQIMLHPLITASRTRGMFVGLLAQNREEISDISLILFTIAMISGADALESFLLYGQIKHINSDLAEANAQLQQDIMKRMQAEKALKAAEEKYRGIFENAVEGIFQITPEGRFLSANPALAHICSYDSPAEMLDEIRDIAVQLCVDEKRFQEFVKVMEDNGEVYNFDMQLYRKDRSICWVSINARTVREESGRLYYEGTLMNITDQKALEAQLIHSQKMEAIGRLAGGIAHDFNNILTGIIGYGSLLDMEMDPKDPLKNHVEQIMKSANNAAVLTQSLLTFGRKQVINFIPLDINNVVKNFEKLLSRLISEDIEFSVALTDRELTALADKVQLEQVLMNIVTNAKDAMPRGGRLKINTDLAEIGAEFAKTHGFGKHGNYALISIEDTGTGMDEKTKAKIFEPFFTTKESGKGTGLGLANSYGIIKQHNGYIICSSEPAKGTRFDIYMPLVKIQAEEDLPQSAPPVKGGNETILVAEDNIVVRKLVTEVLKNSGYRVLEATDGEDAVKVFHDNKDEVRLLITDVIMPKKNGKETFEEIKKSSPDIKAIMASGYTADIINQQETLGEGINFLPKPIFPDQLLKIVREVLDR